MTKREGATKYLLKEESYFIKRQLTRYAGAWSLWSLGVAAVIAGNFYGWNFGLAAGGFGGMLVATMLIAIAYICMCFSLAELSPALPHTGGGYSFARTAMGPWGGFITGLGESIKYILTPAVIVVGIGSYLDTIFSHSFNITLAPPIWWLITYGIFVAINLLGAEISFKFTVFITFLALLVLLLFWIGAIPHIQWENAYNITPQPGASLFLPFGWGGIGAALPFAFWFYLAIEQLPLAAEETQDPQINIPKGLLWGIATLVIASFLTLILSSTIAPGAAGLSNSAQPLFVAFETIFGANINASFLSLIVVLGLIASFHTIIYAHGRNIFALSRAGYYPKWLSHTNSKSRSPYAALIAGAILGYLMALMIEFGNLPVGATLLGMAVFGALISYIMQMLSFILLRRNQPYITRPFISPLGSFGAYVALTIFCVALIILLTTYLQQGVYGCIIWFAIGLAYFFLYARHRMILSPEEEFALDNRGK